MLRNLGNLTPCSSARDLLHQLLVHLRPQEPAKGVLLHQGEDATLGNVKGGRRQINQVPQSDVFGDMINIHLRGIEGREDCDQ